MNVFSVRMIGLFCFIAYGLAGELYATTAQQKEEPSPQVVSHEQDSIPAPARSRYDSLKEDPNKWYYMLGVRLRMHIIASFFYSFKVEGAYTEIGYGVGIEATFRTRLLDIIPSVWFHDLSHKNAYMREKGDADYETELIINNMRLVMLTVDFLNSVHILNWLYFFYGAGVGLGIPVTRIERWEVKRIGGEYVKCSEDEANPTQQWCDSGGSYGENDPWPVYPYLNILFGLRFKPLPYLVANLDMGIGTGFIFGVRASYIF